MGTIFFGGQIPVEDWKKLQQIINDKNANRQPKEKLFCQSDCIREGLKLFIDREKMMDAATMLKIQPLNAHNGHVHW